MEADERNSRLSTGFDLAPEVDKGQSALDQLS
jgi:hypothetical protein